LQPSPVDPQHVPSAAGWPARRHGVVNQIEERGLVVGAEAP
jgi:hypothetical protein